MKPHPGEELPKLEGSVPPKAKDVPLPPASSFARKLGRLALDLLGVAGWTWLAIVLPLPVINDYLTVKNALIAFVAIVCVGRAILDTFFYDRYP